MGEASFDTREKTNNSRIHSFQQQQMTMTLRKIDSSLTVFDTELDRYRGKIEERMGYRLAGIVFGLLLGSALVLSIVSTIISYRNGQLIVSPVIPVLLVFALLGHPMYWCINQFFIKRRYYIDRTAIHFELYTLLKRGTKVSILLGEYGKISFGHKGKSSILYTNHRYSSPGYYYVCLPHKNRMLEVILYRNVQEQLSEKRLSRYSRQLNLPLENRSPNHVPAGLAIRELARHRKISTKGLQELVQERKKRGKL